MNRDICNAITDRKTIAFNYKGMLRRVEPHCYGVQHNGSEGLSAWQLVGGSGVGYRLFLVNEIDRIIAGEHFERPRPDYQRGDSRFSEIYAEL